MGSFELDVRLDVAAETLVLFGPSGAGKTTTLNIIAGLLTPDAGEITLDGVALYRRGRSGPALDLPARQRRIGYVFQGAALFDSMTVYENVVISLVEHGETDEKVLDGEARRVLSAVGLLPDLSGNGSAEYEREYKILANKKPSDLSGGMRKRVGVARALVGSPNYIFYDEPTTGLDPVTSQQIDDLIGELAGKLSVTSLVITHDMFSVFNIADHVVMIDSGVVRFQGTVPELRASKDEAVVDFLSRYIAEGF